MTHMLSKRADTLGVFTALIDGPSGSGKTTLADLIARNWPNEKPIQVVHMDDIYPGWNGLEQGSALMAEVLNNRALMQPARFRAYDWKKAHHTHWVELNPGADVIVEGCGAMSEEASAAAQARIWLDADEGLRKQRALSRGGEGFEMHWDEWSEQFNNFVSFADPKRFASLTASVTGSVEV